MNENHPSDPSDIDPAAPCNGCGARCCRGEVIWLMPEQGDVVEDYTRMPGINPLTGREGWFIPQTPVTKKCVYLAEDDACSIYEHRPVICRHFQCWTAFATTPLDERLRRRRLGITNPPVEERGRQVLFVMRRSAANGRS